MDKHRATVDAPRDLVRQLRSIVPIRPLTMHESLILAERQATRALNLIGNARPGNSIGWITELPRIEVALVPRYKMGQVSGATTFTKGRYLVLINGGEPRSRRRFTLAHEFLHLLNYTTADTIHSGLGRGDEEQRTRKIEEVANYFAACLLMPKMLLRQAWQKGIQDPQALASLFDVSQEAMEIRLRYLGFLDDDPQPVRTYFRQVLSSRPGFLDGSAI
jgi:Zn-dependent peptidase ImmA (M78 family)